MSPSRARKPRQIKPATRACPSPEISGDAKPWAELDRELQNLLNRFGKPVVAQRLDSLSSPRTVRLIDPRLGWNHKGRPYEIADASYLLPIAGLIEDSQLLRLIDPNAPVISPWKSACYAAASKFAQDQRLGRIKTSVTSIAYRIYKKFKEHEGRYRSAYLVIRLGLLGEAEHASRILKTYLANNNLSSVPDKNVSGEYLAELRSVAVNVLKETPEHVIALKAWLGVHSLDKGAKCPWLDEKRF
jgi:hypothetical protein